MTKIKQIMIDLPIISHQSSYKYRSFINTLKQTNLSKENKLDILNDVTDDIKHYNLGWKIAGGGMGIGSLTALFTGLPEFFVVFGGSVLLQEYGII